MPRKTYAVSYQGKEGFTLRIQKSSAIRDTASSITDTLCAWTGHRFCNSAFGKVETWAYNGTQELLSIPITREQADIISEPDAWTWLDEENP